jgi:mono/diheme cytochrome c family protein
MTRFWIGFSSVILLLVIPTPVMAQDAGSSYKTKCAMCHGADGKGDTPAGKKMGAHDFASDMVQKQSDAELAQIISKGKNKMPAYGSKLKPEEIKDLVSYVRKLVNKP